MTTPPLYVGIDLGTSGCRAVAIDEKLALIASSAVALPEPHRNGDSCEQDPELWWQAASDALSGLTAQIDASAVHALAVDGTSGSVLLCDEGGTPLTSGLLYNDGRAITEAARIAAAAPPTSGAHGATSGLAKLLYLQSRPEATNARYVMNQAEWITARLSGRYGLGDENNCLKLGYDVVTRRWPDWLDNLGVDRARLPKVMVPGSALGTLDPSMARQFGLSEECRVMAGTTDSIAGFLATGAYHLGEAVTSLGSTLVLKVLAARPVFDPACGIYSHRLGKRWLAGGASNSGGAVLRHYFKQEDLDALTPQLDPYHSTDLDYYPLLTPGERFPVQNPRLAPRLEPRPDSDVQFLQGMLEGIARIEAAGYRRLAELGAPAPTSVRSVGGGARNEAWTLIRGRELSVPMMTPTHSEAAYGTARLAAGAVPL